jgi:hypothetical protein
MDESPESIVKRIDEHCKSIDKTLRKILLLTDYHSKEYRIWFAKRGFTFKEYYWLFDSQLVEEDYFYHPAYRWLDIVTQGQRRYFINHYSNDVESYLKLLQECHMKIGETFFRKVRVTIPDGLLYKHAYISGMTGSGKSELAKLLFYHLQRKTAKTKGYSLVFIDPHGDLSEDLKKLHLNKDQDRVVYIDPALDRSFSPVINPLELKDKSPQSVEKMKNRLMTVMEETMPVKQAFTGQMKTIFDPCLSVLLRKGDSTFLDLLRFFDDNRNEDLVSYAIEYGTPRERDFFQHSWGLKGYKVSKDGIRTRIQQLLNIETFYNLTVGKSTIDLEKCINDGKVVIFNLSKSSIDESIVSVIGKFVMALLLHYAFKRPKKFRRHTFVFIDECQNFVSPTVATILDETRKFGLHLILINQFIDQMSDKRLKDAIKINTNVKLFGKNTGDHYRFFKGLDISEETFRNIKNFQFCIKAGDRQPSIFTSSDMLIQNPKYLLTDQEEKAFDDYQLHTYYKKIGEPVASKAKSSSRTTFKPYFDE